MNFGTANGDDQYDGDGYWRQRLLTTSKTERSASKVKKNDSLLMIQK